MKWRPLVMVIASHSKCKRRKVGAIIHKEGRIISTGWNGTPSGLSNTCEDLEGKTKGEVIHAEANAILFASKYGIALEGCTLVCSTAPCIECAKMIIQAGITKVNYLENYSSDDGVNLLTAKGIPHCILKD